MDAAIRYQYERAQSLARQIKILATDNPVRAELLQVAKELGKLFNKPSKKAKAAKAATGKRRGRPPKVKQEAAPVVDAGVTVRRGRKPKMKNGAEAQEVSN